MASFRIDDARVLVFLRHGQYEADPKVRGGRLTELGREQVRLAAQRLSEWPIDSMYASDLGRARESAQLVSAELGGCRVQTQRVLREMLPTSYPGMHVGLEQRRRGKQQLEAILAKSFRPSRRARTELYVCHGNLIRALVCLALGVRLTAWRKMRCSNAGLTSFAIFAGGDVRVLGYDDVGHLPPEMVTAN